MSTTKLDNWVDRLAKENIPTFATTARRMAALSNDKESSASDLAKVILQDSTMTAQVLRMVNSAYYNPTQRQLDTVSYAIVILGFEKVRNLALTVSMLETSLNSNLLGHVKQEMACAYHAAVQAKSLAKKLKLKDTESIYIAALLHRLGQLVFWCFPYEHSEELHLATQHPNTYERVEKEILGFSLKDLTDSLITEWNLSPLLHDALTNKSHRDQKKLCIQYGFGIADCAKESWESGEAQRQFRAVSAFLNCSIKESREWIYRTAQQAENGLKNLQLNTHQRFIAPRPDGNKKGAARGNVVSIFDAPPTEEEPYQRQRRLLRELTHQLNIEKDLNRFLLAVLDGIHQATMCDQSFIVINQTKDNDLTLKQHIGPQSGEIAQAVIYELNDATSERAKNLRDILSTQNSHWSGRTPALAKIGNYTFMKDNVMVSPIFALGKRLGYIFSINTGVKPLEDSDFECFCHFCEHANIAFRMFIRG